jgi:hypothetical protein
MKNYTEQLKKHWKSRDLIFIATYTKHKGNTGFFNSFINSDNKKRLYYLECDDVEIIDKRVSFYYNNGNELIDGEYYKVELEYSENSKRKNNPYSLSIKKISELNQDKISKFLEKNIEESSSVKYFGCYYKTNETFAAFKNVIFSESGEVLMFQGESQKVFVSPNIKLAEGVYYTFSIKENKGKLPNAIPSSIEELSLNPYQEYIRLRFERLNNPEANKMIANLMREIGKGMYSSKQRMIFELLQNADDAPGKEKVEFHIDINGDYFFIMHDGAPFNKDDIEAITSAAESTKRGDNKKTGYKGIGFKSVFTDSSEVWLKSGGYQFAFLRNCALFENFDNFYFSSKRYKDHPEFVEEDKLKFRNQRLRFNGSTDIPWQVIPIWHNKLPNEFNDSNFNNFNNPVQFALKLGEDNIEEYKTAIDSIVKRPQFLLFLRNTSKFRSPKNGVTVSRTDNNNVIEIEKSKVKFLNNEREQHQDLFYYTKQIFEDILVSDEAFSKLNIGLRKQSKINDYNEISYYFTDLENRVIETIPPKLASAIKTEISFGISLIDNKISPEKEYIKGLPRYSSLFTYLPMEDTRFQLPFLVNADFVPSSDRQRIQGDNLWNKYIMIKVAEKHIDTLAFYATEFIKDNSLNSSYLSLLLKDLIPEDETAQQIINSYNQKYLDKLVVQEVVVNDKNELQLLSDTIIDDSGLIELFGNDIFYEIVATDKQLPHSNLEISYLKDYEYLNVELIDLKQLAEQITPEICERLGEIIAQKSLYDNPELLKWLNKLVKYIPGFFRMIPFILHNNSPFSLERLIDEDGVWLINEHTSQYATLIDELGYHTVQLNLDKYSKIKEYLHSFNGYINDKTLTYERIASNSNLHKLPISSKLKLIDFFQNSSFMVGIGETKYYSELALFVDEDNNPRPLQQLLSHQEPLGLNSILKFRIKEEEFKSLPEALKKELIAKKEIFISFILDEDLFEEWSLHFETESINSYVSDLKDIYSWIDDPDEISSAAWASIPWLFIDDETRFITTDKVYWSKAFNNLSADKFEAIKTVLHSEEVKILPVQECGLLIIAFPIKTDDSSEIDWLEVEELEMLVANTLLDWMEDDGGFRDFFKNYMLVANTNNTYEIEEIEDVKIFDGSNKDLTTYIQSNIELSSLFSELDKNICSDNRYKIGLLQGEQLVKAIIDSGKFDHGLAIHLPNNISFELLNSFIVNLPNLSLKTDKEYDSNSPEHIIVYSILKTIEDTNQVPNEDSSLFNVLKNKLYIDDQSLKDFDTSNAISFGRGEIIKGLNLSDVLTGYKGESDVLEVILESFTSISNKRKLRKLIFKTRILESQEIHYEIENEEGLFYSETQVVFQLLDKSYGNKRNWAKLHFDDFYREQGSEEQLYNSYKKFLDILIKIDFTELSHFKFHDLILNNCIDKNFAIKSESIPNWLEEWVNNDQVIRLEFLSKLGYNGDGSAIVNLRKSMVAVASEMDEVISFYTEAKSNHEITWNTIEWLSKYSPEIITKNKEIVKRVNNSIKLNIKNTTGIIIPVIISVNEEGIRTYKLKKIEFTSNLYFLQESQEYDTTIFNKIKAENKDFLLVDSICGEIVKHFNIENIELSAVVDKELLEEKSKLWDEPFYKKWEHFEKCPIYIYEGSEVPYIRTFNNITINKTLGNLMEENNGVFYFSKILKSSILNQNPSILPEDKFQSLKDFYIYYSEHPDEFEDDPLKEKYNETFDRMIQDRYGISEESQNDENSNAKKRALYYLEAEGYGVNEGHSVNDYAALYGIKDSDGNNINFIVKSAKGGLLFLNKSHWDMLKSEETQLITIYPGNEPRIFKDRMELLEDEMQHKVLFRIPNNKKEQEIDGVFDNLESDSHLILVTSKKMKESLFDKIGKKGTFNKDEEANVMDDNIVIE